MTDCKTVEPRLEEYRVDLLPAEEKQSVETHLAGCAPCSEVLARIRSIEDALLGAATDPSLSQESLNAGLARLETALPRKNRWKEIIPMAAAALALLGTFVWLLGAPPTPPNPATQDQKGYWEEKQLETLPEGFDAKKFAWSPDGKTWACVVPREKKFVMDVGGKLGPEFDVVGVPGFSPDSRTLAYFAMDQGKAFVVSGETRGEAFNEITVTRPEGGQSATVLWAPDGHAFAYQGKTREGWFVVAGTTKFGPYGIVHGICWAPDSSAVAFHAAIAGDNFVVVDGRRGEIFDAAYGLTYSPDGKTVAYLASEASNWFVMRGERRLPGGGDLTLPVWSPDGRSLVYVADGNRLMIDGAPDAKFPLLPAQVTNPVFSPDGKHLAARGMLEKQEFIILDGKWLPERFHSVGTPFFSPDSSRIAYVANKGNKHVAVVGSDVGEKFAKVEGMRFSPDGKSVAYRGERFGKQVVVAGKAISDEFESVVSGPFYSADSKKVSFVVRKGLELWSKVMDVK